MQANFEGAKWPLSVSDQQFLLVAGSTRPGEEAQLIILYRNRLARFPQLRIALVPRHIDRTNEIITEIQQQGVSVKLAGEEASPECDAIRLVNRMGILVDLYAAADLAFVGGTLADIGGHNLLEAVWAGTPVLFGPSVHNVQDAAEYIQTHKFGTMIQNIDEMETHVADIISGQLTFARKTKADLSHSATATAGNHILKRVRHA